jgi:hypothetical protein
MQERHSVRDAVIEDRRSKREQKNWTRDSVARGTQKGRTFGKERQAKPEDINGIRNQGAIWQLCQKGDNKWQWHQRTKQETGATSGKCDDII